MQFKTTSAKKYCFFEQNGEIAKPVHESKQEQVKLGVEIHEYYEHLLIVETMQCHP